jgi:hypothetical protein
MIGLIKSLLASLSSLCLFQVASNCIELMKINIITFINKKDQSIFWKYGLNIILFAVFSLLCIGIIDLFFS